MAQLRHLLKVGCGARFRISDCLDVCERERATSFRFLFQQKVAAGNRFQRVGQGLHQ